MTAMMPERRLLAAVVGRAVKDIRYGTPAQVADAMRYIEGPNLDVDCDWLELDPAAVREGARKLSMARRKHSLTAEQVAALHGRYMAESLSIGALAREANVSASTLTRAFADAELPTRKPGRRRRRAMPPRTAQELGQLISSIAAVDGVRSVRVTVELTVEPDGYSNQPIVS